MTSELLEKAVIAVVSLGIGYAVGRYRTQATMGKPHRERLFDIGRTVIGVIAVVAIGLTVFQVQSNSQHDREVAQCFAAFATESAERTNERSIAAGERDRTLIEVVDSVLSARSAADSRAALQRFREAVAETERVRAVSAPLAPPRCE